MHLKSILLRTKTSPIDGTSILHLEANGTFVIYPSQYCAKHTYYKDDNLEDRYKTKTQVPNSYSWANSTERSD